MGIVIDTKSRPAAAGRGRPRGPCLLLSILNPRPSAAGRPIGIQLLIRGLTIAVPGPSLLVSILNPRPASAGRGTFRGRALNRVKPAGLPGPRDRRHL
jgi:hypothetical protein